MDVEVMMDEEVAMDVDVYLKRIGYSGSREPTKETLFQLVAKHQLAVPFENIDFLSVFSQEKEPFDPGFLPK